MNAGYAHFYLSTLHPESAQHRTLQARKNFMPNPHADLPSGGHCKPESKDRAGFLNALLRPRNPAVPRIGTDTSRKLTDNEASHAF
jgi:hypothetical protein